MRDELRKALEQSEQREARAAESPADRTTPAGEEPQRRSGIVGLVLGVPVGPVKEHGGHR